MDYKVDLERSRVDKLIVTEDIFNGEYEYTISYDMTIYFSDFDGSSKALNRIVRGKPLHKKDRFTKTYKERPEYLKKYVISEHDDEEGTVDEALSDFINYTCTDTAKKLQFLVDAFGVNVPDEIVQKAYNGKMELGDLGKLRFIEFNYKKASIKNLILKYGDSDTDVDTYTVELRQEITDDDVDEYIPGKGLLYLYNNVHNWLREDYDNTIKLLNNIFKVDLTTLKGCNVL